MVTLLAKLVWLAVGWVFLIRDKFDFYPSGGFLLSHLKVIFIVIRCFLKNFVLNLGRDSEIADQHLRKMALCYTRLLCRRTIDFRQFRHLYTCSPLSTAVSKPLLMGSEVCEKFDEKNIRLKRPMSPHMTIYQVQLTAFLSITHRTTGIILSTYAMLLGLGTLGLPGGIPCLIEMIEELCLPGPVLFVGKTLIALPATFHTFNGLRHLAWDMGKFLNIKQVYSTGYLVCALSAVSAVLLGAM